MTTGTHAGIGAGRARATAALLGAALAMTLAACGGEAPPPAEPTTAPNGAPAPQGAWTYTSSPDGTQRSAVLKGPDGTLEFRTTAGRPPSGTLELNRADIACPPGCRFEVNVDDDEPASWSVVTDESPTSAASFQEPGRLWRTFSDAHKLVVSYPRGEDKVGTATFDVTGADPGALPDL